MRRADGAFTFRPITPRQAIEGIAVAICHLSERRLRSVVFLQGRKVRVDAAGLFRSGVWGAEASGGPQACTLQ